MDYSLKAGDYIRFGEGEYEDYSEFGDRIVLKDFNLTEEAEKYLQNQISSNVFDFLKMLDEEGLTKTINVKKFYTGSSYYDGNDFDWFDALTLDEVEKRVKEWEDEQEKRDKNE